MKESHIFDILDEKAFVDLNSSELDSIRTHAAVCTRCETAFRAAQISSQLLKSEAVEEFAPPPFFQTKVLAAVREKREKPSPFAALVKLWRASAAMVLMMAAMTVGLIALTVLAPGFNDSTAARNSTTDIFENDLVIADEKIPTKEPTNEQILRIIYASDGSATKK